MKCTIHGGENTVINNIKEFLNCYKIANKLESITDDIKNAIEILKEAETEL